MKKLGRKLTLSALSLGLAVVTLSTTTFAWYTSNKTVSASGIMGATSGETDSTLLISKTGEDGSFSGSVEFTESSEYTVSGDNIMPLHHNGTTFLDKTGVDVASTASEKKNYLQFSVFIKTQNSSTVVNVPVYLSELTIENTQETSELPGADIIRTYTTNDWIADAKTYKVDAAQALNVAIAAAPKTGSGKATTVGKTMYSVNDIVGKAKNEGLGEGADALKYYNAVMGEALTKPATGYMPVELTKTSSADKEVNVVTLESRNVYEVVFTVWLDGWDQYCFDACKNQSFNISFSLTTDKTKCQVFRTV